MCAEDLACEECFVARAECALFADDVVPLCGERLLPEECVPVCERDGADPS